MTVIASQALTDNEVRNVMERGSLEVFRDGMPQLAAPIREFPHLDYHPCERNAEEWDSR